MVQAFDADGALRTGTVRAPGELAQASLDFDHAAVAVQIQMTSTHTIKKEKKSPQRFLEGNRWVSLGLLLILTFNLAIRWRLADMPLERDEGEYAYAGQSLLQGNPPYRDAYNMKFPGTYLAYAGIMAVFGETARGIHLGLAIVTSLTALLIFCIGKKLFDLRSALLAAASHVLLAASTGVLGLAGHATHFVALFATAGVLALLWADEKPVFWRWSIAGALFGVATLMKQHAAILAGFGFLWCVWRHRATRTTLTAAVRWVCAYLAGCMLPLVAVGIWLALAGVWKQFHFWTIQYAQQYASAVDIRAAWPGFLNGFTPILSTTWAAWLAGLIGLAVCVSPRQEIRQRVILILFLGGLAAACPGFHFRGHYFLPAMTGLALSIGAAFHKLQNSTSGKQHHGLVSAIFCAALGTIVWSNGQVWLNSTPEAVTRRLYHSNPFLESSKVADYLRERTRPDERIAVVGSEPQIYFYANRKSATGYIYTYALTEPLPLAQRMRDEFAREIETAAPRYIVFVDVMTSWVSLSQADTTIFNWWNRFATNYDVVATVILQPDAPTIYHWDEAAARASMPECHLIVYRRK